jgi:large subunit ribosomal protein L14e
MACEAALATMLWIKLKGECSLILYFSGGPKMMEIGRLCIKTAGRDAGKKCVIVDIIDDKFVMVDGETRRRKCNIRHLEPLKETIKISKGATNQSVVAEFKKLGIDLKETKPRKPKPKQKKIRSADRKKLAPKQESKKVKAEKPAEEKKAEVKAETKLEKALGEEK